MAFTACKYARCDCLFQNSVFVSVFLLSNSIIFLLWAFFGVIYDKYDSRMNNFNHMFPYVYYSQRRRCLVTECMKHKTTDNVGKK